MTYEALRAKVYALLGDIPAGRVVTYGQIALMVGAPAMSRAVGRAMGQAPPGLPCHRVVGSGGRLSAGWPEQRSLLEGEGVAFTPGGNVRLRVFQWRPWEGL